MKLTKKTIVIGATLSILLLGGGTAFALNSSFNKPAADTHASVKSAVATPKQSQEVTETKEVAPVAQPTQESVVAPAPTPVQPVALLTVDEYAVKYLNVSNPMLKKCFDTIVSTWPDRFNSEIRESNVKALRIFSDVCATGIQNVTNGVIYQYGRNGEFFDTDGAKSYAQQP